MTNKTRPAAGQTERRRRTSLTRYLTVVSYFAYVPPTWRSRAGGPDEDGVPTKPPQRRAVLLATPHRRRL